MLLLKLTVDIWTSELRVQDELNRYRSGFMDIVVVSDVGTEPSVPSPHAASHRRLHRCHPHLRPSRVSLPRHPAGGASTQSR